MCARVAIRRRSTATRSIRRSSRSCTSCSADAQRLPDRCGGGCELVRETVEQRQPRGLLRSRAAHELEACVEVLLCGAQPRPERELVTLRGEFGGGEIELRGLLVRALRGELVGLAGHLVGACQAHEAPQLAERIGVVLDANVEAHAPGLTLGGD